MNHIIFDLTGVLFSDEEDAFFDMLCREKGLKKGEIVPFYKKFIHMAEKGEITLQYVWAKVSRRFDLNIDPVAVTGQVVRLKQANPAMLRVVKELRSKWKTVFLANYAREYWERIKEFPFKDFFDEGVVSYTVGFRKPEHGIFQAAVKKLGVPAAECVYVDDSEINVDAAKRVGMKGIVFTGKDAFLKEMESALREG